MSIEFLIILALSAAATFFVVSVSVGLVIHKSVNARSLRLRRRLSKEYSEVMAKHLLRELPPLPRGARTSALFDQYEVLIKPIKDRFLILRARRRRQEREALRLVLLDFVKDVSGEVSERLIYFFYAFGFVDDEIKLLSNRHWWIRAQAARDAGLLKARRAITALTAALEDDHYDVRIQAMESLVRLVGVEALRTIFRVSRDLSVWTSIELSTIVMEFKESAVPYLVEGLDAPDQSVVLFCIEMLAGIGFVAAVEPLRILARDNPNLAVRAKAIEALGRLGDERAEPMLTEYLDESYPPIRFEAIRALSRIGAPRAIPKLLKRMLQGGLSEKIIAARAIAAAGPGGFKALSALAAGGDAINSAVAEQILEELDPRDAEGRE